MEGRRRFWTGVVIFGFILLVGIVGRMEFDSEPESPVEEAMPMDTAAGLAAGGVLLVFGGIFRLFELSPPRNRKRGMRLSSLRNRRLR